jgi:L-lactate dehydrogenase complex protein LldG
MTRKKQFVNSREEILSAIPQISENADEQKFDFPSQIVPSRKTGNVDEELDLLINEINKLNGVAKRVARGNIKAELNQLVNIYNVNSVMLWNTPLLRELCIDEAMDDLGMKIISSSSKLSDIEACDLGITDVDYALPETGSLVLFSSSNKSRIVSLVPRIHLAIVERGKIRPDLHEALEGMKQQAYSIIITGPSRTADIELTVTLGVHGPKELIVWCLVD